MNPTRPGLAQLGIDPALGRADLGPRAEANTGRLRADCGPCTLGPMMHLHLMRQPEKTIIATQASNALGRRASCQDFKGHASIGSQGNASCKAGRTAARDPQSVAQPINNKP